MERLTMAMVGCGAMGRRHLRGLGALRDAGGKGVHFSGPGLREHAARWAEKVVPWLDEILR